MKKIVSLIAVLVTINFTAKSQVLISLLLGDKLNSDNLEFGLIGGMSSSSLSNFEGSQQLNKFHLGFYFDIKITDKLWFDPSVYVKVSPGVVYTNLNTAVTGIEDLDSVLVGATVERVVSYFQVPLLLKYNITPKFHVLFGPQAGLRTKVYNNYFVDLIDEEDLNYKEDIKSQYKQLDFGMTGGLGYRIKPGGMNIGFQYHYGMVDVLKDNPGAKQSNQNMYFYVTVPIGKEKKPD